MDAETFAMIGKGLIVIGAGLGIGKIGGSAMDAIARQPEATAKIQTAMIIAAALIEGIGLLLYLHNQISKSKLQGLLAALIYYNS